LRKASIETITDLDKSLKIDFNFQLHNISDLVNEFGGFMPPNRISHYVIAFISAGKGMKTIGNHSFEISENMGLVFPKNIIHSTNKWSLNTTGYMLSFNESLFEEYQFPASFLNLSKLFKHSVIPYRIFQNSSPSDVMQLFEDLLQLQNTNKKLFILKLSELLLKYEEEFCTNATAYKTNSLFDNFVEIVESDFKSNKEVKSYAERLSVHPNYLNKVIRSSSQLSAKEFIHQRIIQEAKYLLSATSIPIKEIAFELGFNDYNYFSRLFKNITTQTPFAYRKQNV